MNKRKRSVALSLIALCCGYMLQSCSSPCCVEKCCCKEEENEMQQPLLGEDAQQQLYSEEKVTTTTRTTITTTEIIDGDTIANNTAGQPLLHSDQPPPTNGIEIVVMQNPEPMEVKIEEEKQREEEKEDAFPGSLLSPIQQGSVINEREEKDASDSPGPVSQESIVHTPEGGKNPLNISLYHSPPGGGDSSNVSASSNSTNIGVDVDDW